MSQVDLTGAEITIRCLQAEGVEFVFGYPGGAIMPFYHALPEYPGLRHVLVRHEQAAALAARIVEAARTFLIIIAGLVTRPPPAL